MSCRDFVRRDLPPIQTRPKATDRIGLGLRSGRPSLVRGDGTVAAAGLQQVKEELAKSKAAEKSSSSDDESAAESSGSTSDKREYSSWEPKEKTEASEVEMGPSPSSAAPQAERPLLRRIKSSLPAVPTSPLRHHHRTMSQHTGLSQMPQQAPPPSPSVRTRQSSFSHPDISDMVDQYATTGPANQTLVFKPKNSRL